MNILLALLLIISVIINGMLIWYTRKLVQNLYFGINNVEELQRLLNEYVSLLEPLATMENYYNDPIITSAVANTKLVIDACRVYKKTLIEDYEETQENQETEEAGQENSTGQEANQKAPRKAEATIGPISPTNS